LRREDSDRIAHIILEQKVLRQNSNMVHKARRGTSELTCLVTVSELVAGICTNNYSRMAEWEPV